MNVYQNIVEVVEYNAKYCVILRLAGEPAFCRVFEFMLYPFRRT